MKNTPALLLPLLALCLLASCASPEFRRVAYPDGFLLITRSKGPQHLVYSGSQKTSASANAIAGKAVDFSDVQVRATNTRVIPAEEGHGFDMLVAILGLPDGEHEVTAEITHPLFLPPEDRLGTTHRRTEKITAREGLSLWSFAWVFDDATQRVPGKWTVRLFHRDKLIFQDSITGVASPKPPPA